MSELRERIEDARLLREEKKFAQAIKVYTELLDRYPTSGLFSQRGITFIDIGNYHCAVDDLSRAIELNRRDHDCYVNRANALIRMARYKDAIADLNVAIELRPTSPVALNSRGHAYELLGKISEARQDFQEAIAIDPRYVSPKVNLAKLEIEANSNKGEQRGHRQ